MIDSKIYKTPTCAVCYNDFNNVQNTPRLLIKCGHLLCEECIKELYHNYSEDYSTTFTCFKCKSEYEIVPEGKKKYEYFPVCEKTLEMVKKVDKIVECTHFNILPQKFICLDNKCTHKNYFCLLCSLAIHVHCDQNLIFKLEDFETKTEIEELPIITSVNQNISTCTMNALILRIIDSLNKDLVEMNPTTAEKYLKNFRNIHSKLKDEKINLSIEKITVYELIEKRFYEDNLTDNKILSSFLLFLIKYFIFLDNKKPNVELFNLLENLPCSDIVEKLEKACYISENPYEVVFKMIDFLKNQKYSVSIEREVKFLEKNIQKSKEEIIALEQYYISEMSSPWKDLLKYVKNCRLSCIKKDEAKTEFSFEIIQEKYQKINVNDIDFRNMIGNECMFYFTERGRQLLKDVLTKESMDEYSIMQFFKKEKDVYFTGHLTSVIKKELLSLDEEVKTRIAKILHDTLPIYSISVLTFEEVKRKFKGSSKKILKQFVNVFNKNKCLYLDSYYLGQTLQRIPEGNKKDEINVFLKDQLAFGVNYSKCFEIMGDVKISADIIKPILKKAMFFKSSKNMREEGLKISMNELTKKEKFRNLLIGVESQKNEDFLGEESFN